jgi:hypothetical protein
MRNRSMLRPAALRDGGILLEWRNDLSIRSASRSTPRRQDKGQKRCVARFLETLEKRTPAPIPFHELMEVSRVTIAIAEGLR